MERQSVLATEDEVVNWIEDGMTIAIGEPAPMAMVRRIIRKGISGLTIAHELIDRGFLVYLGKEYEVAEEMAKENKKTLRIVKKNDIDMVITMDMDSDRINVAVIDGVIVEIIGVF